VKPCPICGDTGPWAHGGARAGHIRSHHEEPCPDCGVTVNVVGLASHRRYVHGVVGQSRAAELKRTRRARADTDPAENMPADIPAAPAPTPEPEPEPETPEPEPETPDPAPERPIARWERCPDCDKACRSGAALASHRRAMHRPAAPRAQPGPDARRRPGGAALAEALTELLPGAAPDLIGRLAAFVEKHEPEPGMDLLIVATPGKAGPWLCRPAAVGMVVAREHTAAVVVAVDDVYAHVRTSGQAA